MRIVSLPRESADAREFVARRTDLQSKLTARQQEIVELLLEGDSNKVIARKLGISPNTVKVHVHAIFRELNVHSRIGLLVRLCRVQFRSAGNMQNDALEKGTIFFPTAANG